MPLHCCFNAAYNGSPTTISTTTELSEKLLMNKSVKIACIGESRIGKSEVGESSNQQPSSTDNSQSLACSGDALTTAIYLARFDIDVSFITVLEESAQEMVCKTWQEEGMNTELVLSRSNQKFLLSGDLESIRQQLTGFDYVYLTGNTLALLDAEGREKLFELLVSLKEQGGKVIFDSNHSAQNWSNDQLARAAYEKFMRVTDISLPSFSAEADLFGDSNIEELIARQHAIGIEEITVKNGTAANWLSTKPDEPPREFPVESIQQVVDSSGAGDAFNAAYLATRLNGTSYCGSIKQGQLLAAEVVIIPGAIFPRP